jgi:hypothetical protein
MQQHQIAGMALASFTFLTSILKGLVKEGILTDDQAQQIARDASSGLDNLANSFGDDTVNFARQVLQANASAMEHAFTLASAGDKRN